MKALAAIAVKIGKDLIAISAVTGVMTLMLYCLFTPQL